MNFIEKNVFDKHYPLIISSHVKWGIVIGGTLFVALFTSLFQPFYLSHYDFDTKVFVISSWTAITFISLIFNLFVVPKLLPKLFKVDQWKVKSEILWINYNIFFIAFGFFLFKVSAGFYDFNLERIIYGILATLAVGFIPVTIYVLVKQYYITRQQIKALEQKRRISLVNDKIKIKEKLSQSAEIQIVSERKEKQLSLSVDKLVYIESDKNYLNVYVVLDDRLKLFRIRNKMKILLDLFADHPNVMRTHRAFIVNLQYAKEIKKEGNSHKLILLQDLEIPVSRTYLPAVLKYLEK